MIEYNDEEECCCVPFIVKCIMDFSYVQTQVNECCIDIYKSNEPIRHCVDGIASVQHSLLSKCYYLEPEYDNWLCIVSIDSVNENEYKLCEDYIEIEPFTNDVVTNENKQYECCITPKYKSQKAKRYLYDLYEKSYNKYTFTILKIEDEYFIYQKKMFKNILEKSTEVSKCTYTFLSILYKKEVDEGEHPIEPIPIELDKGYYMEGNIILTPAFILRKLVYMNNSNCSSSFTYPLFDVKNYSLEIMDHNLKIFTIYSDQYILLEKDTYKIISVDSDYSESHSSGDIGMEII
jgi:hypothetical protein